MRRTLATLAIWIACAPPAPADGTPPVPSPAMFAGGLKVEKDRAGEPVVYLAVPWDQTWKVADCYTLIFATRELHAEWAKCHGKLVRVGGRVGHGASEQYVLVTWINEDTRKKD